MKYRTVPALAAVLTLWCSTSRADVDCTGTVTRLSLYLDSIGIVTPSLSSGPSDIYLCGVDQPINGVSPTVCRSMYAALTAAKVAGRSVQIRFYDHNSCAAIPAWAAPGTLGWTDLLLA